MDRGRLSNQISGLKSKLVFLLRYYAATVLLFVVAKVVFMVMCREGHSFGVADVKDVIVHGLSLDLSTALYLLILPFLLTMVSLWWQGKALCRILTVYNVLAAVALALAFVADTSLYPFWGFKLDASCLQYIETPGEAMASVTTGYIVGRLIALIVVAAVIVVLLTPPKGSNPFSRLTTSLRTRLMGTLLLVLLIPVMVIGIRGGVDESTTNIGQVYYSQNQFLNHAAVNPVFSFLASLEKTASANTVYTFYSDDECSRITDGLFPTGGTLTDTLLTTTRPNVVIILMESCGSIFMPVMPHLSQLADQGVAFTNCYGNSYRTDRGTVSTLSGYPAFPTMSVMKMPAKTRTLAGLAASLRREGYETSYLYGGDINFTNMRSYLIATGFEQLTWKADYSSAEQRTAQWGVRDDITFGTLYDMITAPHQQPFFIGFSTLSSHEPWDVPTSKYPDDEVLNAFSYLDECIGSLVDRLRQTPQWRNLLIVLLPDHSISHGHYDEQHPDRNRIPMIWTGGAVSRPVTVSTICNQTDLAATLLAQMGIDHTAFTFSRNVLADNYRRPFAIHTYNNGFSMVDSTMFVDYDLTAGRIVARQPAGNDHHADSLATVGKAILQLTSIDLSKR